MTYEEMIEDETFIEEMQTRIMSDQEMDTMYIPDVEYMNIDGISRILQILVPRKRVMENEKYPLIVYVQGSAWHKQNVYQHVGQLNYLCKQGFVVAIVQYRESDLAPFPAQIEDTKTAIRFLRKHHEEYFIDEQNVFLFGDSSGGHVALVSGLTSKLPLFNSNLYSEYSNEVRAIIDFYGVRVKYEKSEMSMLMLGYAISIHKSQGGSAKVTITLTPSCHAYMMNSNLLYVALTRTKEKCFHIGDKDTVNRSIKKKENFKRNTFLLDILKKLKIKLNKKESK